MNNEQNAGPIAFKKLQKDAQLPRRNREGDAGFDLHAQESCEIWIGGQCTISTGIACELPKGYVGQIWPRSGMAIKHMINSHAGIIDSNYRGEIMVCLINHGDKKVEIRKGDRIAQLVVPYFGEAIEVEELSDTERGLSGFGSSGA